MVAAHGRVVGQTIRRNGESILWSPFVLFQLLEQESFSSFGIASQPIGAADILVGAIGQPNGPTRRIAETHIDEISLAVELHQERHMIERGAKFVGRRM